MEKFEKLIVIFLDVKRTFEIVQKFYQTGFVRDVKTPVHIEIIAVFLWLKSRPPKLVILLNNSTTHHRR